MRIVMPLFEFEYSASQPFAFTDCGLTIEPFASLDIPRLALFSAQDVQHMEAESWALVYDGADIQGHRVLANLLLMSFRIFSDHHPPFIKYRLCDTAPELCARISQPMTYNFDIEKPRDGYQTTNFQAIDTGFQHLRVMGTVSPRTSNSLYFT